MSLQDEVYKRVFGASEQKPKGFLKCARNVFRWFAAMLILGLYLFELFFGWDNLTFLSAGWVLKGLRLAFLFPVAWVALSDIMFAEEHEQEIEFLNQELHRLSAQIGEESRRKVAEPD
jgi:hypothetical protein